MKRTSVVAGLAAVAVAAILAAVSGAQNTVPTSAVRTAPQIAFVDVAYVFKNHARFKQMMDSLKSEMQQADAQVRAEQDSIRKMVEQLQNEKPGTTTYKQLEEQIAKRRADLQVQIGLQRKEFLIRQAKIHSAVYQEIQQVVRYYATQNNILAVFNFNGEPINSDDPESVLATINKSVVYYANGLDITPVIVEALNRGVTQTATPRQPAGSTQPTRSSYSRPY